MSSQRNPKRPPGSVGGLIARRQVVHDVEANDAGPLPDRPENAPKRLIDPALLNDELADDATPPEHAGPRRRRTRPAVQEPAAPAAPAMPTSVASEGRRRRRPTPDGGIAPSTPDPPSATTGPSAKTQSAPAPSQSSSSGNGAPHPRRRAPIAPTSRPAAKTPAGPTLAAPAQKAHRAQRAATPPPAHEPAQAPSPPDVSDGLDGIFDTPAPSPSGELSDDLEDIFDTPSILSRAPGGSDTSYPGSVDLHAPVDATLAGDDADLPDTKWAQEAHTDAENDTEGDSEVNDDASDLPDNIWDDGDLDPEPAADATGLPPGTTLTDYLRNLPEDDEDDADGGLMPPPALYGASPADGLQPPSISGPPGDNHDTDLPPTQEKRAPRGRRRRRNEHESDIAVDLEDAAQGDLTAEDMNALLAAAAAGDTSGAAQEEAAGSEPGASSTDGSNGPEMFASASRGVFGSHSALSLISPNLTPHEDELNDALSAFSALDPGTKGFIRVDFRAYPAFKGASAAYVQALRTGQDPEPKKSPGRMVFSTVNWLVRTILHYGTGAADKGAPAPAVPWKRAPAQLISSQNMSDETRQAIRDAENKAKSPNHYETLLSVGVVGPAAEKDQLEHIRVGVEAGFDVYATTHQRLVWRERPGYDALIGYMPPDHEKHLVLSAEELAELARVPDTLTRPQGVIVHRAQIKPLPPTNPIIIDDPLNPDGGKIPLGVIHKGTDDEKVVGMRNSELDQHMLIAGRTGTGKSLCAQLPVPTPAGWTTMGALKKGDEVFDEDGNICTVTHAWPVRHERPCYEIVFNDGSTIIADGEHQWLTKTWAARKSESEAKRRTATPTPAKPWAPALEHMVISNDPVSFDEMRKLGIPPMVLTGLQSRGLVEAHGKTTATFPYRSTFRTRTVPAYDRRELHNALYHVAYGTNLDQSEKRVNAAVATTDEIRATLNDTYDSRPNHSIDLAGAAQYPEQDLPLGSYTLGAFLGDGSNSGASITTGDAEIRQEIINEGTRITDRIERRDYLHHFGLSGIRPTLRSLNLATTGSKHIPDIYKTASIEQRLALLQGLMDTDGSADQTGNLEFYSTQKRLAEDVLELVSSLGLLGRLRSKEARCNGKDYGLTYTVSFSAPADVPVFRLPRKLERQRLRPGQRITNRLIVDVRPVPSVPVRCIAVDSPNHLFLVGRSFIPTHNSKALEWLIHGAIKADYPVVVVDPHGALCDDIVRNIIQFAPERVDDVVLIDFGEEMWPVALNPLDINSPDQIEPTVESVKEMLAHQMNLGGDSAPRAVAFATQALAVLTEANLYLDDPETKTTLLQVTRFFQDTEFRQLLMNFCSNPSVRETFDPEYGAFEIASDKQRSELSMPILRAFQPLGNSRSFANVFSAGRNRLDFERLVLDKKIIMLKLSHFGGQGGLASFVGSLAIPYLLQSMNSWGRVKDPETGIFHGRGLRLFIDEAATVCGPNSAAVTVLAQARKWDLGLVAAVQFPKQLDRSVEEEFYSNTASKISLALDPQGVGGMARSIAGDSNAVTPNDIVALPNYAAYQNVLLAGADGGKYTSGAFAVHTLPPMDTMGKKFGPEEKKVLEYIRMRSRELICNPRDVVEQKRMRHVEDIRSALTQALSDRAGEIPGLNTDADDEGTVTNLNLDGSPEQDDAWLSSFEDP